MALSRPLALLKLDSLPAAQTMPKLRNLEQFLARVATWLWSNVGAELSQTRLG
jgi:hypothetical protein